MIITIKTAEFLVVFLCVAGLGFPVCLCDMPVVSQLCAPPFGPPTVGIKPTKYASLVRVLLCYYIRRYGVVQRVYSFMRRVTKASPCTAQTAVLTASIALPNPVKKERNKLGEIYIYIYIIVYSRRKWMRCNKPGSIYAHMKKTPN